MTADRGALSGIKAERQRLSSEGPAFVRADGDFERVSLPETDASVLRDLFVSERPATVIEIGLAYGASALAIAEALVSTNPANARHVIIDAYQDHFGDAGWTAIGAAGLTEVCSLLREQSQLALPQLLRDGVVADAAFVDGSHIFHDVFVDLQFLRQLVRPGGLASLPRRSAAERSAWERRPVYVLRTVVTELPRRSETVRASSGMSRVVSSS